MMKESGLWYLPYSEYKVPGKLSVSDSKKSIVLKLYTTSYLSENAFGFIDRKRGDDHLNIVLGDTQRGHLGDITLLGCSFAKLAPIAGDLYELHYRVQFVFHYIHILKREHFKFNNIKVLYPHSDNFFNGWQSVGSIDESSVEEYQKVTSVLKINENLTIDIVDSMRRTVSLKKDFELKHSNHLTFNYGASVDIDLIYKDCLTLQKMMEFSSRRNLTFIIESAEIEFDNIENQEQHTHLVLRKNDGRKQTTAHTYIFSRLTLNQEPFENTSKLNQNWLLFSGWTESYQSLNTLISNWFKNKSLQPIYDFYLDTTDWGKEGPISNVNFNNRFLNLMQGLEAYYDYLHPEFFYSNKEFVAQRQKVYNAIASKELKLWVSKHLKFPKQALFIHKLEFLCQKYSEVLVGLKTNPESLKTYPDKAKEYRHKLSHGKISKTFQGKDFHALYSFSQVLLCICILDSLGMPYQKIIQRIDANPDLNRQIPR